MVRELGTAMLAPNPDADDAKFWEFCKQRSLRFQRCLSCGAYRHPPGFHCWNCAAPEHEWVEAHGPARLFTFTVAYHAPHPSVREHAPYIIAVVEYPDQQVRVLSNLLNVDEKNIAIGDPVELVWREIEGFGPIFRYQPTAR